MDLLVTMLAWVIAYFLINGVCALMDSPWRFGWYRK